MRPSSWLDFIEMCSKRVQYSALVRQMVLVQTIGSDEGPCAEGEPALRWSEVCERG